MRILFTGIHRPNRSPSQRFRFEQFIEPLRARGHHCTQSWIIEEDEDRVFYQTGGAAQKAWIALKGAVRRAREMQPWNLSNRYDVVVVQREAYFAGGPLFEALIAHSSAKLVFDFDDAIWIPGVSKANRMFSWAKPANKTRRIVGMSDAVFAGNSYLAEWASQYSQQVTVIPTTIDTDWHRPCSNSGRPVHAPVCIGWTGSFSTVPYLRRLVPTLERVQRRYGDRVWFRVIGDPAYQEPSLGIQGLRWNAETEVEDLHPIDIGLMPLPDDAWSKGKCGCKALQYMAVGVPPIVSPVGVNTDIVAHGENGLVADSDDEWFEAICRLVEGPELRRSMGAKARQTVVSRYSSPAWIDRYEQALRSVAEVAQTSKVTASSASSC